MGARVVNTIFIASQAHDFPLGHYRRQLNERIPKPQVSLQSQEEVSAWCRYVYIIYNLYDSNT